MCGSCGELEPRCVGVEVGVWGTDNVDQNLITSTDTATGWEDIEQMISKVLNFIQS